jgi:hypothetical protein
MGGPLTATPPAEAMVLYIVGHDLGLGLPHSVAHRGLGQIEVLGDLTDRAVTTTAQLDDLGLGLRRERAARTRLLLPRALRDGHRPSGAETLGLRCPPKRIKPSVQCDENTVIAPDLRVGDRSVQYFKPSPEAIAGLTSLLAPGGGNR